MRRAASGCLAIALLLAPAVSPAVEVGDIAPRFQLSELLSPERLITSTEFSGKVVYIDFWSAWCAPCREALPGLSELRESFTRDDFEVVSINVDQIPLDALRLLEEISPGHPVIMDPAARTATAYGVVALPSAFLVDRQGVVRGAFRGADQHDLHDLRRRVDELVRSEQQREVAAAAQASVDDLEGTL